MNRRVFLKRCGGSISLLALSPCSIALGSTEPKWTALGPASAFPVDEPTYVKAHEAFIIRRVHDILALSARCTHRDCIVSWSRHNQFVCPCHQARFAADGALLKGPATAPLSPLPVKLEEGQIWLGK